ncbi:MAG: M48 family metallopeptidase [Saprospiraceae bacterium]|nr:M48 family metallopeptidase [Saprospiraceae bacterium]
MQILQATYYKGIKPVGKPVAVYLENDAFRIVQTMEEHEDDRYWDVQAIHPDDSFDDNRLILSYGVVKPLEYLEFNQADALMILENVYPGKLWEKKKSAASKNAVGILFIGIGIVIALSIAAYFIIAPRLADKIARNVPIEWELDLGKQVAAGLVPEGKVDTLKSQMLDSFFTAMKVTTDYPIKLYFVRDTVVNAFAMPGGSIVVYQGLFDKMQNYEALAGLLGHEFAHVEKRHSLRSMFRSLSGYMFLSLLFGDLTGIMGVLLDNANSIQNLSYSREFEREADARAVELLMERNIGLSGMQGLFQIFLDEGSKGLEVPEFMRTHPVTQDRIDYVKLKISETGIEPIYYEVLKGLFDRMKAQ